MQLERKLKTGAPRNGKRESVKNLNGHDSNGVCNEHIGYESTKKGGKGDVNVHALKYRRTEW